MDIGQNTLIATSERGGLYIHVPYCRRKCIYCDFFSAGERIADWHKYVDALCSEFKERIIEMVCPLRTVYFGGGTPSLMPVEEFHRLYGVLKPYMSEVEEFTVEVNPDDVDEEKLQTWKNAGVNRLSIGIQSFDDNILSSLGRLHNASSAKMAYRMARRYFDNISVDLIFGLPEQSLDMWKKDLKEAIAMHPEHISAYSLMYEEGTALTVLRDKGRIEEPSEDTSEKMFILLINQLKKAGYEHYETSNFALPGFRSRHNSSYWLQKPYLGLGPSAHSYDGLRTRKANRADIRGYIGYWTCSPHDETRTYPFYEKEILTEEELLEEYVMTRMRVREGIPLEDFKNRFGWIACVSLLEKCKPLIEQGVLIADSKRISIDESAILISDTVILEMLKD